MALSWHVSLTQPETSNAIDRRIFAIGPMEAMVNSDMLELYTMSIKIKKTWNKIEHAVAAGLLSEFQTSESLLAVFLKHLWPTSVKCTEYVNASGISRIILKSVTTK